MPQQVHVEVAKPPKEESPIELGKFGDNIVLVGKEGAGMFNRAIAPDHENVYIDNPSLESLVKEFDAE